MKDVLDQHNWRQQAMSMRIPFTIQSIHALQDTSALEHPPKEEWVSKKCKAYDIPTKYLQGIVGATLNWRSMHSCQIETPAAI